MPVFALAADGALRGGLGWTAGIGWRQAGRGDADDETGLAGGVGHGPFAPDAMVSPRVAPRMIALGLLGAIPAADGIAWADP